MIHYSTFIESLNMILDETKHFATMMQDTYYINEESLPEYFEKSNFNKIFEFIFDKFSEIIKDSWDKFKAEYKIYNSKASLLKKYKNKLYNINWDIEIEDESFTFTNLDNSTNINMYKMILNNNYRDLMGNLGEIYKSKQLDAIHTIISTIYNELDDHYLYMEYTGADILGLKRIVTKDSLPEDILNYYRISKANNLIINKEEINKIAREYFESKSVEKVITNDIDSLLKYTSEMKDKFTNIDFVSYLPQQDINIDISSKYIDIIREYINRVQDICNMYIQVISIKLDVVKMYKEQQVRILSKAILKSIKEGKM